MAQGYSKKRSRWGAGVLLALGMMLAWTPGLRAQEAVPEFDVDYLCKRGAAITHETQVEIYTRIPYPRLSFISTPSGFTARYEVSAEVSEIDAKARKSNVVLTRLWDGKVVAPTYSATQEEEFVDFTMQTVSLPPGRYVLGVQIEDKTSNQVFVRETPLIVRDLNKPVAVSDVSLLDSYDPDRYEIKPLVSNRIGTNDLQIKIFYEVYAEQGQPVTISHQVIRREKDGGATALQQVFEAPEDEGPSEVVYEKVDSSPLEGRTNQFIVDLPLEDGKAGVYEVLVRVEDAEGHVLDTASRTFTAQWTGLYEHLTNLDEAIDQLAYIAKKKEVKYIRAGETEGERYRRFMEFWKKRDPTPGTRRNERMEEYYYRVAYANEQYTRTSRDKGWQTDRGFVMVRFGEPDDVERHPFSFNAKPYEVWYYWRIGRRFIFIDETGLGDYRLLVPIYDERTRIH